jgi:putative ABC transport system permease protein
MMRFKIAFRNILRNGRRSLMTGSAIAVGAMAIILFGEFVGFIVVGVQTGTVRNSGHLTVFHSGYMDFGSGNPSAYSIGDYQKVIRLIENDPELKAKINVVTPTASLFGIAGNFTIDTSKTFFAKGLVPMDRQRMGVWDEYRLGHDDSRSALAFSDKNPNHGVIGIGLARVLGLCKPLHIAHCPSPPEAKQAKPVEAPPLDLNLAELSARDRDGAPAGPEETAPRIDLLAATAEGAPNVVSFFVDEAQSQGFKDLDDNYVGMNLVLAQQLLYGRGEHKAVGIEIQLQRSEDLTAARARLETLFRDQGLDLEVRDFTELQPQYLQLVGFLGAIFSFIAIIMGVIVLFTIVNTMTMAVMERTNEIGTARAMGVRRGGIRDQFLLEGWMLGTIGATFGVILASLIAVSFNHLGVTYTPPGNVHPVPLQLLTHGVRGLLVSVWGGLMLTATIASVIPANRAARLRVVEALRHV